MDFGATTLIVAVLFGAPGTLVSMLALDFLAACTGRYTAPLALPPLRYQAI